MYKMTHLHELWLCFAGELDMVPAFLWNTAPSPRWPGEAQLKCLRGLWRATLSYFKV
jgi:hypothetical protein